jgi:biopolymer transport protein ExbD
MIEGINVTPLVDITLVLLVIFIVTAKLVVTPAVPLDLPKATQSEEVQTVFAVVVPASGPALLDGAAVDDDALKARAGAVMAKTPDARAVIQADRSVSHGRVMEILDALKAAGLTRVAFGAVRPEMSPVPEGEGHGENEGHANDQGRK